MKKHLLIILFLLSLGAYAQSGNDNRFVESEAIETQNENVQDTENRGPGNPGEPKVSVDQYTPVLIIVALGLIGLYYQRKTIWLIDKKH